LILIIRFFLLLLLLLIILILPSLFSVLDLPASTLAWPSNGRWLFLSSLSFVLQILVSHTRSLILLLFWWLLLSSWPTHCNLRRKILLSMSIIRPTLSSSHSTILVVLILISTKANLTLVSFACFLMVSIICLWLPKLERRIL